MIQVMLVSIKMLMLVSKMTVSYKEHVGIKRCDSIKTKVYRRECNYFKMDTVIGIENISICYDVTQSLGMNRTKL